MSVELHLPDLPQVPISLGPASAGPSRAIAPWHVRLREALTSYLPLLLMAALALATWWLVKNSPRPVQAPAERVVSSEPDYTMAQFAVERFDRTGRLKLRIEGAQMRHFPDTDRLEIEGAEIRAFAPGGRVTLATAKRALGNGDGSEVQLLGGAEVTTQDDSHGPLVMQGEFFHAYLLKERVVTHLPVLVRHGGTEMQASGLQYDHVTRRLDLKGPLRMVLAPKGPPALKGGTAAAKP